MTSISPGWLLAIGVSFGFSIGLLVVIGGMAALYFKLKEIGLKLTKKN